jgi:hypothetical protein
MLCTNDEPELCQSSMLSEQGAGIYCNDLNELKTYLFGLA